MSDYLITEWLPSALSDEALNSDLDDLGDLLVQVVAGGAIVNFIQPFMHADARKYWADSVLPGVRQSNTRAIFARADGKIIGTVLLYLAVQPNQRHRADVGKMLVTPEYRRRGIARGLMVKLEEVARAEGIALLTLDTSQGSNAEPLYRSLGFIELGVIPRYAKHPTLDILEGANFMYKELQGPTASHR